MSEREAHDPMDDIRAAWAYRLEMGDPPESDAGALSSSLQYALHDFPTRCSVKSLAFHERLCAALLAIGVRAAREPEGAPNEAAEIARGWLNRSVQMEDAFNDGGIAYEQLRAQQEALVADIVAALQAPRGTSAEGELTADERGAIAFAAGFLSVQLQPAAKDAGRQIVGFLKRTDGSAVPPPAPPTEPSQRWTASLRQADEPEGL